MILVLTSINVFFRFNENILGESLLQIVQNALRDIANTQLDIERQAEFRANLTSNPE